MNKKEQQELMESLTNQQLAAIKTLVSTMSTMAKLLWGILTTEQREVLLREAGANTVVPIGKEYIDVVMTTLPSAGGEFVELEDDKGHGIGPSGGAEWVELPTVNGVSMVALRIKPEVFR